ncbi:hypothetical protein CH330_08675 [candidate division WOR-3 bacterium JGI_Cruoil_03_51_56]|uniref:Uncharacterized protein n=1 Tax=candidate division WOR-3 bacterium JGI_Cruoil_03_51_56 TaxID=1973747 RepID=A0A235BQG0_UNCW3|nr:MAG: hypothetical protein CH330_08675 [candidate division WOR-3 bacterium JGI_Cruoil_03_51_56]
MVSLHRFLLCGQRKADKLIWSAARFVLPGMALSQPDRKNGISFYGPTGAGMLYTSLRMASSTLVLRPRATHLPNTVAT